MTKLDRLARLWSFHYDQKTYHGYRLDGCPGHWRWVEPDDSSGQRDPPAPPGATEAPGSEPASSGSDADQRRGQAGPDHGSR